MEWIGLIGGSSGDSLVDRLLERGYRVLLIGGTQNDPGIENANAIVITDLANKNEIYEKIKSFNITKAIIGTGHIKAIELAEFLEERNISTTLNIEMTKLAKDKIAFKEKIKSLHFLTPDFVGLNSNVISLDNCKRIEELGFPLVIKSAIDLNQPQKVKNAKDLKIAIDEVSETNSRVLIEKFIAGSDCTVHILNNGDKKEILGVKYWSKAKEKSLKGFENSYSAKLPQKIEKEIIKTSEELMEKLNILGYSKVDFTVEKNEAYILEVNTVTLTGYNSSSYKYFLERGIDISEKMITNCLSTLKNKELKIDDNFLTN